MVSGNEWNIVFQPEQKNVQIIFILRQKIKHFFLMILQSLKELLTLGERFCNTSNKTRKSVALHRKQTRFESKKANTKKISLRELDVNICMQMHDDQMQVGDFAMRSDTEKENSFRMGDYASTVENMSNCKHLRLNSHKNFPLTECRRSRTSAKIKTLQRNLSNATQIPASSSSTNRKNVSLSQKFIENQCN